MLALVQDDFPPWAHTTPPDGSESTSTHCILVVVKTSRRSPPRQLSISVTVRVSRARLPTPWFHSSHPQQTRPSCCYLQPRLSLRAITVYGPDPIYESLRRKQKRRRGRRAQRQLPLPAGQGLGHQHQHAQQPVVFCGNAGKPTAAGSAATAIAILTAGWNARVHNSNRSRYSYHDHIRLLFQQQIQDQSPSQPSQPSNSLQLDGTRGPNSSRLLTLQLSASQQRHTARVSSSDTSLSDVVHRCTLSLAASSSNNWSPSPTTALIPTPALAVTKHQLLQSWQLLQSSAGPRNRGNLSPSIGLRRTRLIEPQQPSCCTFITLLGTLGVSDTRQGWLQGSAD